MGYLGRSGFDSDEGRDWLADLAARPSERRIAAALRKYQGYLSHPDEAHAVSAEYIESVIGSLKESWRKNPPRAFRDSGLPLAEWIENRAREVRDHYESGRYRDESYGPVEPALAAAEIVAAWAGRPLSDRLPESARLAVRALQARQTPRTLIDLASEVVGQILRDEKYRNMRRFHLSAFPDVTGGDDGMAGVEDIARRLREAAR